MSLTWMPEEELALPPPGFVGLLRGGLRGLPLLVLLTAGLGLMLLIRLIEGPLFGRRQPITPWITVLVCRIALRLLGLRVRIQGRPLRGPGAMVANHSSWLDVFVLNAQAPMVFVSKSEVASWPVVGWLARATGTLFVRREARSNVATQARAVAERILAGQTLMLFPEGTSTDGRRVLPFKPALFAGLLAPRLPADVAVQSVTVSYDAPLGEDPRFYGWFGGAELWPHALAVLSVRRPGSVRVTYHPQALVAGRDRKALAAEAEALVRSALQPIA